MLLQIISLIACLLMSCILVNGEFYSSAEKMLELEHIEKEMVFATRLFLKEQQQQLDEYRSFVARVKREHEIAKQLDGEFWDQPLNAFRLTNRLLDDWPNLHDQMGHNIPTKNYKIVVDNIAEEVGLPNLEDLQGTARSLVRLQKIYNITASDFAEGKLNGIQTDAVFIWRDCFEIGVQLYEQQDYSSALEWLSQAANMFDEEKTEEGEQFNADVQEYLALTYIELGEKQLAIDMLSVVLSSNPLHISQHILNYLDHKEEKCPEKEPKEHWDNNENILCQGKPVPGKISNNSSLNCYLDSKRHAIFQLAPLKVEQLHRNPDINVFHQLINDKQIQTIVEQSDEDGKFRSAVFGGEVSDVRVSQQTWLNYTSPVMRSLSQLVGAISGLDMQNAEKMQVADYGIGGQYVPHYDYLFGKGEDFDNIGNRLFTVMFYLSSVRQGGYTVFPELNLFLKPIRGSMVMWNNQMRSLKPDTRMLHAGCPVLEGYKSIANIWIYSNLQEFRLPCTLNSEE